MKLWYKKDELQEAQGEAQRTVEMLNQEIPIYIRGDVKVRMAWREDEYADTRPDGTMECGRCFIPEAEILVNGETARRDLLDLIAIDITALELKAIMNSRKEVLA